jgi:lipopolysaccharide transport system ATP-binding protein
MYVRLGFAVAAHVEPDVLLVDEVLAVGDASFRQRCIQHMRRLRQNGTTVVFVSHNMHLVQGMCDSALLLVKGQICSRGPTADVIADYQSFLLDEHAATSVEDVGGQSVLEAPGHLILTAVEMATEEQRVDGRLPSHCPATLSIHYKAPVSRQVGRIDVQILRDDNTLCCHIDSVSTGDPSLSELAKQGVIEVTFNPLQLTGGNYVAVVRVTDPSDAIVVASGQSKPFGVYATNGLYLPGVYLPSTLWTAK